MSPFTLRSQKSQSQRRFREGVAGEEHGGGKAKKRKKNGGAEVLPEVSRVEVEEVDFFYNLEKKSKNENSTLAVCYNIYFFFYLKNKFTLK